MLLLSRILDNKVDFRSGIKYALPITTLDWKAFIYASHFDSYHLKYFKYLNMGFRGLALKWLRSASCSRYCAWKLSKVNAALVWLVQVWMWVFGNLTKPCKLFPQKTKQNLLADSFLSCGNIHLRQQKMSCTIIESIYFGYILYILL